MQIPKIKWEKPAPGYYLIQRAVVGSVEFEAHKMEQYKWILMIREKGVPVRCNEEFVLFSDVKRYAAKYVEDFYKREVGG